MKSILLLLLLAPLTVFSQEIKNIDFSGFCKDQLERDHEGLNCDEVPVFETLKKDENGKEWKIRFHFGYTDTQYRPTDMEIKSKIINVKIQDIEMIQRTSNHHYNPKNWLHGSALKWIDEPTNTMAITLEKGKNNFYLTVFHPKYLKSILYKETIQDGETTYDFRDIEEKEDFSQNIPEGYNMLYIGNTHRNMNWQIGYGRQFTILNSARNGKLTYIPKVDIGLNTGEARSVRIVPGVGWDDFIDKHKIQGYNASLGHRLEYQKGAVSVFIDHKVTYSKMSHGFYDGNVKYDLVSTPLTFGLGIDLFTKNKKKNKKR